MSNDQIEVTLGGCTDLTETAIRLTAVVFRFQNPYRKSVSAELVQQGNEHNTILITGNGFCLASTVSYIARAIRSGQLVLPAEEAVIHLDGGGPGKYTTVKIPQPKTG